MFQDRDNSRGPVSSNLVSITQIVDYGFHSRQEAVVGGRTDSIAFFGR
jgi:hypothetical protein